MDKEITIDDVIQFIREKGHLYDYDIYRELEKVKNPKTSETELIARRNSMYERLSKL